MTFSKYWVKCIWNLRLAFQDVLKNAECQIQFRWLIRVFFTVMLKLISILFLFSKIFLEFSVTRGMNSLKNNNTCIQEKPESLWQVPYSSFWGSFLTPAPTSGVSRYLVCAWPRKDGAMPPSWSRGDLDLVLSAGSATQSRASRAGRGAAGRDRSVAKAWLRRVQSTICFRVPWAWPWVGSGTQRGREWTFGSQKPCVAVSPWAGGSEALRRSEGWQALSPEYGVRPEIAFCGLPGSWPRPRPQCRAQPWAPPHG